MSTTDSNDLDDEFQKADVILADALLAFQDQGVSQYVIGMTLLEIGIAALVKLDEPDTAILDVTRGFIDKCRSFQTSSLPFPPQ